VNDTVYLSCANRAQQFFLTAKCCRTLRTCHKIKINMSTLHAQNFGAL